MLRGAGSSVAAWRRGGRRAEPRPAAVFCPDRSDTGPNPFLHSKVVWSGAGTTSGHQRGDVEARGASLRNAAGKFGGKSFAARLRAEPVAISQERDLVLDFGQ